MTDTLLHVTRIPAADPVSGPPAVLLHGFASAGTADWPVDALPADLAEAGRDVLVVDLPGHGAASAVAAPLPVSAVLALLVDLVGDAEVDLVGYSLGARLAWDLAARARRRGRRGPRPAARRANSRRG
ncbi:MAG: alpha/beta fold hydrolase, partial [Microbacterium sp.]